MKAIESLIVITLLGIAPIAGAQINIPDPTAPGNTPDSAVRLMSTSDVMLDRQISRWIRTHYPGWNADPHEFVEIGTDRYAVVYITSTNNPGRRIYFRVMKSPNEDDSPMPSRY